MLDSKRREFIALVGGGALLLAAKVKRARGHDMVDDLRSRARCGSISIR